MTLPQVPIGPPTMIDCAPVEVDSIKKGASENKMSINLTKTKELVVRGRSKASIPTPLPGIEQVDNFNY